MNKFTKRTRKRFLNKNLDAIITNPYSTHRTNERETVYQNILKHCDKDIDKFLSVPPPRCPNPFYYKDCFIIKEIDCPK